MRLNHSLTFLALVSAPLPAFARRASERSSASFDGSPGSSNATGPPHFSLDSTNATIFAFSLVFAFLTALQSIAAFINILRRLVTPTQQQQQQQQQQQHPIPHTHPILDVGHVFPVAFLLSTLMLTVVYTLRAVYWAIVFNEARFRSPPSFQDAYIASWASLAYLTDIFLVLGLLALICYRGKALRTYSGPIHLIKPILDGILMIVLLGLSSGYLGFRGAVESRPAAEALVDISRAYSVLFLVATLDVFGSSIFLWLRAQKQHSFIDRKLAICLTLIISPMLLLYAIFGIIPREILLNKQPGPYFGITHSAGLVLTQEWDLILIVISCFTKFVIISMCLKFGVPPRNQRLPRRRPLEQRVVPARSKH